MKTALIQINPTVGALEANTNLIISNAWKAFEEDAQLIVFPELTISGYPPEDLILKNYFCSDCAVQLQRLEKELPPEAWVVVGVRLLEKGKKYNSACVIHQGKVIHKYNKILLPNYGVFDEKRLFEAGTKPLVFEIEQTRVAIHICEDSWEPTGRAVELLQSEKIDLLVNLSASPYYREKLEDRICVLAQTAKNTNATLLYCNLVGGQDELVFDGASMVLAPNGQCLAQAKQFEEDILYFDSTQQTAGLVPSSLQNSEEIYEALKLGLKD